MEIGSTGVLPAEALGVGMVGVPLPAAVPKAMAGAPLPVATLAGLGMARAPPPVVDDWTGAVGFVGRAGVEAETGPGFGCKAAFE